MGIVYGNYEILEEFPSTSNGFVYRARYKSSGEIVIIKVIDMNSIDKGEKKEFYKTAKRSCSLEHKNIATVMDVWKRMDSSLLNDKMKDQESAYIVQEFILGKSLEDVVNNQGPCMPQLGFYIIHQVIEALVYGHRQSIPHRNLTMDNIILMKNGKVKLVDYGIGRLFSSGIIYYMSPEDISGGEITEKSEIFTIGVILFEILMGIKPFQAENFAELMNIMIRAKYDKETMAAMPDFIRPIILKCLAKDPKKRYDSFEELLSDIEVCQRSDDLFAFDAPIGLSVLKKEPLQASQVEEETGAEGFDEEIEKLMTSVQEEDEKEEDTLLETAPQEQGKEPVPETTETTAKTAEDEADVVLPETSEEQVVAGMGGFGNFSQEITTETIREEAVSAEGANVDAAEEIQVEEKHKETFAPVLEEDEADPSDIVKQDIEEMKTYDDFVSRKTSVESEPSGAAREAGQEMYNPFIEMISEVPMFANMDSASLDKFTKVMKTKNYTEGDIIIKQGQPGEYLYVILDGAVSVIQEDTGGNEIELTELAEGDCFGEMALLTGDPCSATIRSKRATTLLSLYKDDFDIMINENLKFAAHFNKILAQRLRKTNLKFENEIEKGVAGSLEMISLIEFIQTVMLGQKTGRLVLTKGQDGGVVYFDSGSVACVTTKDYSGQRAFYMLLEWETGTFRFKQGKDEAIAKNIEVDTNGLLMEGMRRIDESIRLIAYLQGVDKVFHIEEEILKNIGVLELSQEAKKIAELFDGKRTVQDVTDDSELFKVESLEAIIELYTKDLLTEV